ncbi:hypothetical protein N7481_002318 [Penicillium waksmanii]|uniref:uncharacterized protein n=1 Tax=Penicillium waksmanii TaxID=69791 RepID=UPI002549163D|nr:uncharacterized protein N7481_002318 [Penicillium waksmanii]KAJ5995341.1 hypothetical protein N7481_002318 [Penicillium waksmanii]
MTRSVGLRQYRACVRCRSRKTRCDLQSIGEAGKPPCLKCEREGAECVLAGSRRGGDYSRFRQTRKTSAPDAQAEMNTGGIAPHFDASVSTTSPGNVSIPSTHYSDRPVHDNLQNPSDALLILAHAAGGPGDQRHHDERVEPFASSQRKHAAAKPGQTVPNGREHRSGTTYLVPRGHDHDNFREDDGQTTYPPLQNGTINIMKITTNSSSLVRKDILDGIDIWENLKNESFLMSSILVIASKDHPDLVNTHKGLWDYLRQRILDVIFGAASTRRVGYVEGLLLLGEWNLVNHGQTDDGGGEAAWSILGLAVRLAYRLRLEDAFRGDENEVDQRAQRNRLAWTFTYLSDRQISIRMGQAFWCRGPGLAVPVTAEDFPSLQSQGPNNEENLATWIQAQVELTTLFGNAHDILFPSKARTVELIVRGDYVKYIDDTTRALSAWQYSWRSISVSKHLRSCLTLMREYLRLYVSAFAFQAVLYRASRIVPEHTSTDTSTGNLNTTRETAGDLSPSLDFPNTTMASPDARYIYDALDAAESLLKIFIEDFDPQNHLRYMPARFYLYEIHSSVFLFKAHASGAIPQARYAETKSLITRFITHLQSVTPDETHISTRHARLLQRLWFQSVPENNAQDDEPGSLTQNSIAGGAVDGGEAGGGGILPFPNLNPGSQGPDFSTGVGGINLNMLDEIGLETFDYVDAVDGFLAMPPVFPYDLSMFFNGRATSTGGGGVLGLLIISTISYGI